MSSGASIVLQLELKEKPLQTTLVGEPLASDYKPANPEYIKSGGKNNKQYTKIEFSAT